MPSFGPQGRGACSERRTQRAVFFEIICKMLMTFSVGSFGELLRVDFIPHYVEAACPEAAHSALRVMAKIQLVSSFCSRSYFSGGPSGSSSNSSGCSFFHTSETQLPLLKNRPTTTTLKRWMLCSIRTQSTWTLGICPSTTS